MVKKMLVWYIEDSMLTNKENDIKKLINSYNKIIVAFSGGVDSSLLLYFTKMYAKSYIAITFLSYLYSDNEKQLIDKFVKEFNINHKYITVDPLADIKDISTNPHDRCYICKYHLYSKLNEIKFSEGYDVIFDGSNADDKTAIRPGAKAISELAISSPLAELNFNKAEIRNVAKKHNLPMYNKPSLSCYFTRFEYNVNVSKAMIKNISSFEEYLHSLGLSSARCRVHNSLLRIQLNNEDMLLAISKHRNYILEKANNLGYKYTTVDLGGEYSCSMDV